MLNYFYNKKIMIIVPHEDDELNLTGGLLSDKYFNPKNVIIVYTTNGDYLCNFNIRLKEACRVAKKLHIPLKNLIFLGYADQHIKEQQHIYMTHKPNLFVSKKGNSETFGNHKNPDFHYKEHNIHSKFNYESLFDDFMQVISFYMPDVIFVNDFDSHPDHRATSLIFDKVMGKILKEYKKYRPFIYKGFAYPTAYKGISDFDNVNMQSTKFKTEPFSISEMQNPYYNWNERIRFPVHIKRLLPCNLWYKLLKKHRSQLIVRKASSILNGDMVFFQRISNNLCLTSSVSASSGVVDYINDFLTFDVVDISRGDRKIPSLCNQAWIPESSDYEKSIIIKFEHKSQISQIVCYQNLYDNSRIQLLDIVLSNGYQKQIEFCSSKLIEPIDFEDEIEWVKIKILKSSGTNAGLSEVEVIAREKAPFEYFDIELNHSFSPHKYYVQSLLQEVDIKYYYYNGSESKYLNYNDITQDTFVNEGILYGKNIFKYGNLSKKIIVKKFTIVRKILEKLYTYINGLYLKKDILWGRVLNKVNRVCKKL